MIIHVLSIDREMMMMMTMDGEKEWDKEKQDGHKREKYEGRMSGIMWRKSRVEVGRQEGEDN